jgi:hypothetical protein
MLTINCAFLIVLDSGLNKPSYRLPPNLGKDGGILPLALHRANQLPDFSNLTVHSPLFVTWLPPWKNLPTSTDTENAAARNGDLGIRYAALVSTSGWTTAASNLMSNKDDWLAASAVNAAMQPESTLAN